jgi:tetratricopeptide (TPR) repeat protein
MSNQLLLWGAEVDLERRVALREGAAHRLSPTEARLLGYLARRSGPVPAPELLQEVWATPDVHPRTVRLVIDQLRAKIELDPAEPDHLLEEEEGYRFERAHRVRTVQDERLSRLLSMLERGAGLLTLVGSPGTGKSYLARHVASLWEARGVTTLALDLEGVHDPRDALARLATALGLRTSAPDPEYDQLRRALAVRAPLLLVLEHLDELVERGYGLVQVPGVDGVSVLATAERSIGSGSDRVVTVEPLAPPAARRFLLQLAREAGAREDVLTDAALDAVTEATEGLPLALQVAAAWLAQLRPIMLGPQLQALRAGPRGLMGALLRAWDLLEEGDILAMGLLCAVPGPLPIAAFEAVTRSGSSDRPLDRLARLRQRAWISMDRTGRVAVPATSRAFVAGRTQAGVTRTALNRMSAWAASTVRQLLGKLEGEHHVEASVQLERDLPLWWALVGRMAPGPGRARLACDLAAVELRVGIGPSTADKLAELVPEVSEDRGLGALLRLRRVQVGAREDLRAALERAEGLPDKGLIVEIRTRLGRELARSGALDEARAELQRALDEARELPRLRAHAELELGAVDSAQGDWAGAMVRWRSAEATARQLGSRQLVLLALAAVAGAERQQGHEREAETALRQALELAEELGAVERSAELRLELASLFVASGSAPLARLDEAVRLLQEAHTWYHRQGLLRAEALALRGLAHAHLARGEPAAASRLVAQAREAFHTLGDTREEGLLLLQLARLEHHGGRPSEALRRYDEAQAFLAGTLEGELAALAAIAAKDLADHARAATLHDLARARLAERPEARGLLELVEQAMGARSQPDSERVWAQIRARLIEPGLAGSPRG